MLIFYGLISGVTIGLFKRLDVENLRRSAEIGRTDILEYSLHFRKLGWDCTCLVYSNKKRI